MNVARQFGTAGAVRYGNDTSSAIIYSGTINDGTTVTLELNPGGIYELFTYEYTAETGAYRGHHLRSIVVPVDELYGTTAVTAGNDFSSTNSGVSIAYPADSTVTLARSADTYEVKYVLMSIGASIGNPSSMVGDVEEAKNQAQAYAQAASDSANEASGSASDAADFAIDASTSATAAELAVQHYPKIEDGYWYVWDGTNNAWVNTGIAATGQTGATPDFSIGNVVTLPAGSSASATITGTDENPVLNLFIPRGSPGGLILANNKTVATADWSASVSPISSDFPYEATITILGVTSGMVPDVIFGVDDAMSGTFAPVSESVTDGVVIYASDIPISNITIPTIMVHEV